MMHARWPLVLSSLVMAGCAAHPGPPVIAAAPPVEVAPGPPLPAGATPGMLVPQQLADGDFPTPNRGLSGVAAIWHLRAGLNVAALSCAGVEGAAIRVGYNAWLKRQQAALASAQRGYAALYRGQVSSYDEAMTRLYNFFAQTPVRPTFCAAAARITAEIPSLNAVDLAAFAQARLALLDQPFTDFYRAYAAWRDGNVPPTVIAVAATTPPAPLVQTRYRALTLDLSTLPADTVVTASR